VDETVIQRVKLSDIDPSDVRNHKNHDNIYLGGLTMTQLINEPLPSDILKRFKNDCLKFLVELCVQIRKRFPLNEDSVIAKLNVLDPTIASNVSLSPSSLTGISSYFPNLVPPAEVNELDDQWRSYRLTAKELPISSGNIPQYWYDLRSIKDGIGNSKFGLLSDFMTNLSCLPHSSACVERIFSQVNNIKTRKTNSLKAQTVADRILAKQSITKNNSDCTNWEPIKALISDVKNGTTSARYMERMKENTLTITLGTGEEEEMHLD
jgi:hypothetical protein